MFSLLTSPGQLRRFLLVSAQSSVATAMGYVALLLIAHDQLHSPWALAIVLTANLLPSALLGPYFGKLADRRSRRNLCVTAAVIQAVGLAGVALSGSFAVTAVLTGIIGAGSALFRPASRSAIPTIGGDRSDDVVGAVVTISSASALIGPGIGALLLLVAPVQMLLLASALTFAVAALVLLGLTLDGPKRPDKPWVPMTLDEALAEERFRRREIREGLRAARAVPGLTLAIGASAGATFSLGMANVGEPLLATERLGGGEAAFPLIVALFGVGATVGALLGSASLRRLIAAILAAAVVMALIAVSPTLPVALVLFTLGGLADGLSISCDQRLVTAITPEQILGRAFGLKDSLDALALLAAYSGGAAVAAAAGPRWVFGASAVVTGLIGIAALVASTRQSGGSPLQRESVDLPQRLPASTPV